MRTRHKLSESKVAEILDRYAAGEPLTALAREYGVTLQALSYHLRKRPQLRRSNRRITPSAAREAEKLWKRGLSAAAVARRLGIPESTITHYLQKAVGGSVGRNRIASVHMPQDAVQLAYLAALFDSEGCISGTSRPGHWQLTITNTSDDLRNWLGRLGGRFYTPKRQPSWKADRDLRKAVWVWKITADLDVLIFLEALLPFLVIKRDKARAVVAALSSRAGRAQLFDI